ncbi:38.7KD protein [Choristoneura occidentalis granulovirus]|uniref:38.7KD protein n=1 Tax=Choristoneura occidentalis granulovirus TaxID=364745 RepID=Q1A4P2_9BBAC|nr:38.7KD protein [Choristoneura fumiferana granulovirus]ABC61188.1 38.7KD protein [Choristoneura fumiferana granulovirus]
MNYYLNKLLDYLFGNRIKNCEKKIQLLTNGVNRLYHREEDDASLCMRCGNLLVEDYESTDNDSDSDSSNFGVFVKPRINNHTHVRYVTGKSDHYILRKNLYYDMENIVDIKDNEPRKKIKLINDTLHDSGYELTDISKTSKIIDANVNSVKKIIQNVVNNCENKKG